ncbi:kinesin-like protein KIN-6 isoform X2 [Lycium barbarum]|uniref:kinesin-like protein KIN-6 isoform X2 n=1 Tax=Lycium barbarum TaxID=112863 RepID=UPI00293E82BD|nr:kinesin-like protein KIN-6 isoform X2 [Lycium barbarum]
METKGCSPSLTVRRNPPRKARPTPCSAVAPASSSSSPPRNISLFPIEDILSMEVPQKQPLKVFMRIRTLISPLKKEMKKTKNTWPKNPNALPKKLKKSNQVCVTVNDAHSVTVSPPQGLQEAKRIKSEVYQGFQQVFSSEASQRQVYEKMVHPLVEDFLKGKSGMLAALGPSGSGKTHTIFGCPRDPGMVPLALHTILQGHSHRIFHLSMFEICSEKGKSEKIFDLIQEGADLSIQQSSIKAMREAVLYDPQQAESLIACGLLKRATAMTNSNSQSSRSQCIINIRGEYKKVDGKVGDNSNSAVLTIVDLAGAEREKKTGNQGIRLLESNFINNTSMVFGLCLRSLLEHQKNPRKPMQKHFQNSLLTRYLRDYLEGKKRMALLLTVRPGEEDYLDTSFLLRQASPYTKIKFDIIEEHGILNHNKRPVQRIPSLVQLKRMKLSRTEVCEINQGSGECPQLLNEAAAEGMKDVSLTDVRVQSEEIITREANEKKNLRIDHFELERKERNNQILQNFGKALWKVLKECKRKLEVAENEVCTLRDCLTSEETRSAELENLLRDWQSNCCCRKGISSDVSIEVDEFRGKGSLDCEEHQSTDCNEVAENETCTRRDCITNEKTRCSEIENELRDWQSNCCCRKGISTEVSSREVDDFRRKSSVDFEDHQSTDCNETAQKLKSSIEDSTDAEDLKNTNEMKAESTHSNDKATAVLSGSGSCTDQDYEREEESSDFVFSISKATFINRDDNDLLEEEHTRFDAVLPECTVSSSGSSLVFENNSSFPVGEDQTQNKEDKVKLEVYSCHLEGYVHTRNEEQLDSTHESFIGDATSLEDLKNTNQMKAESTHWNGKETAVLSGLCSFTDQEYGRKEESSDPVVSNSQATFIDRDENGLLEEDHTLFDSVPPECTVSSAKSFLSFENNSSFGEDQTQNEEDKVKSEVYSGHLEGPAHARNEELFDSTKLLGPSTMLMPEEVVHVVGHCDNIVPEATKHGCGTKFQNADKPKRRLLPASSILLKDIGSINFKDENQKSKGVKAEKKGASGENRTQGSISLLRLLKDNLAI